MSGCHSGATGNAPLTNYPAGSYLPITTSHERPLTPHRLLRAHHPRGLHSIHLHHLTSHLLCLAAGEIVVRRFDVPCLYFADWRLSGGG
ncbi:MAG: hypothetical protein R3E31_08380 [Chloroflexota bacterium]